MGLLFGGTVHSVLSCCCSYGRSAVAFIFLFFHHDHFFFSEHSSSRNFCRRMHVVLVVVFLPTVFIHICALRLRMRSDGLSCEECRLNVCIRVWDATVLFRGSDQGCLSRACTLGAHCSSDERITLKCVSHRSRGAANGSVRQHAA
jgi:hypothetical protein